MTEPKFTKGPWKAKHINTCISEAENYILVTGDKGEKVFDIEDICVNENDLALILAAPDMYEALEEVIKIYSFKEMVRTDKTINSPRDDPDRGKIFFTYNDLSKARKALRKARGETE